MLDEFQGADIVIDVVSQYVFIGKLASYDDRYLVLEDADVHDLRDTATTREYYVREGKLHGFHSNRRRVLVSHAEIVSISRLEDVIE